MRQYAFALFALALTILPAGPSNAVETPDAAVVKRIEAYLNTLKTLKAEFVQLSSDGQFAQGKLYLARPNRLRFDYAPPSRLQIYADGTWLKFVDTYLESVTYVPLSRTVAGVLVKERVKLTGEVEVKGIKRGRGEISVSLVDAAEPDAGRLMMVFREDPLRLARWTVTDPQGIETEVSLIEPDFNAKIDPAVFAYDGKRFERSND